MTRPPQITELINEPDAVEIVRDQIAGVLALELANQCALAFEQDVPDKKDFDITVYLENARPYDTAGRKIKPFVNVFLPKVSTSETNSRAGKQRETATFWIDCAAFGADAGGLDDKVAALKAWKTARIVRRILMSDAYLYLGLRGVVGSRRVTTMETGTPDNAGDSAFAVAVVRIALEVSFLEKAVRTDGEILEAIDFEINPENGEVQVEEV